MPRSCFLSLGLAWLLMADAALQAEEPLHSRIDALVLAQAGDLKPSAVADDAEFLRRVTLDLIGRIPTSAETREILDSQAADKRASVIDRLLESAEHVRRMRELFHVMLMERLGDDPKWTAYLETSFKENKPWDQMAREILCPDDENEATRASGFFYAKRLENYGQNPIDYPGLTRDVGRLFLGLDLQCAQCHDHLFIDDYKQRDFQGLLTIYQNLSLRRGSDFPAVNEKLMTNKLAFMSVFDQVELETGPRLPGSKEIEIPQFPKGEEYLVPPDKKTRAPGKPKFSPLKRLAESLPSADNAAFARSFVNRIWFVMLGRGLVHPLDLHHSDNPPSHPKLLELLASEFVSHQFDVNWLLGEVALSQTYQRSSMLPEGVDHLPPEKFLAAIEKRLSPEQLLWSMLEATGQREPLAKSEDALEAVRDKFLKAYANPPREPEEEFNPSLKAALFVLNDTTVLEWLTPRSGNLIERLTRLEDESALAEELYLSVLSRRPADEEVAEVAAYLNDHLDQRETAIGHLAWALLASTEFCVNH